MSSSDDDDCYGNVAKKLESLKSNYSTYLKNLNVTHGAMAEVMEHEDVGEKKNHSVKRFDEIDPDFLKEILVQESDPTKISKPVNSRTTRSKARNSMDENSQNHESDDYSFPDDDMFTKDIVTNKSRIKKSTPKIKKATKKNGPCARKKLETDSSSALFHQIDDIQLKSKKSSRAARNLTLGNNRRGSRTTSRSKRSSRGRNSRSNMNNSLENDDQEVNPIPQLLHNIQSTSTQLMSEVISIGNNHEYPDMAQDQALFSKENNKAKECILIQDDQFDVQIHSMNEEIPVIVFWKSKEYTKFNLRKFQKLRKIFDHFILKEAVQFENVLFTYKDQIISPDDTPDSINYNFANYIEGGVVDDNVTECYTKTQKNKKKSGEITIKFQCLGKKKPFEVKVEPTQNFSHPMTLCAEDLEVHLDKLKFYFDGDFLEANATPAKLDMEGGECIDVKILP